MKWAKSFIVLFEAMRRKMKLAIVPDGRVVVYVDFGNLVQIEIGIGIARVVHVEWSKDVPPAIGSKIRSGDCFDNVRH
jgi:hypothetical protein